MTVIDDFVDEIETRLLTVAGVSVIVPTRQGGENIEDQTVIVKPQAIETLTEYDRPGNPPAIGKLFPVLISCVVMPSEVGISPTKWHEAAATLGTACQKSITTGVGWHTFGGNSIDAMIGPLEPNEPQDDSPGSIQFTISIKYRVDETDPNVLRA
jgi:hypothetical protein